MLEEEEHDFLMDWMWGGNEGECQGRGRYHSAGHGGPLRCVSHRWGRDATCSSWFLAASPELAPHQGSVAVGLEDTPDKDTCLCAHL